MSASNQLCLPCQEAIRSGCVGKISGPQPDAKAKNAIQRWQCLLCITIQSMRLKEHKRTNRSLKLWIRRQVHDLKNRLATEADTHKSLLQNPLSDTRYLEGISRSSPVPPVGDLSDIALVSPRVTLSECRFTKIPSSEVNSELSHTLRVIPKTKIDPLLVKSWLDHCVEHHELCSVKNTKSDLALFLIDVRDKCLVLTTNARYFALSYVWGEGSQILLQQDYLHELMTPGALEKHWDTIATVLKDAIGFVDSLSERYLWTDTLCIIQDSPRRQEYLSCMDRIYQGAVCTLVAIDSTSAMSPLPGVQPHSRKHESLGQNLSLNIVRKRSDLDSAFMKSIYERRAWTFQERSLSVRCLYFMEEQLYFQCQEATWSEDRFEYCKQDIGIVEAHPLLQSIDQRATSSLEEKFQSYTRTVARYSKKQLTYESDRLNAFAGIIGSFERTWKWDHIAGLPIACLDRALLWVPFKPLLRIKATIPEQHLPSWSWAGWTGGIHYRMATATRQTSFQGNIIPTFAITTGSGAKILEVSDSDGPYSLIETITQVQNNSWLRDFGLGFLNPDLALTPNILIFCTETVDFSDLGLKESSQWNTMRHHGEVLTDERVYRIIGRHGPAGVLMHSEQLPKETLEFTYKYIRMYMSPGELLVEALIDKVPIFEDGYEMDPSGNVLGSYYKIGYDSRLYAQFACIMLVKESQGGVSERVAVGQIHWKAWDDARPVNQQICLR